MVGTEIVVLLAFLSRFSLDRKLTDLKDEISQKQTIIEANAPLEYQVRLVQDTSVKIKSLLTGQSKPLDLLEQLSTLIPADVYLKSLTVSSDSLEGEAIAGTTEGFHTFLNNLGNSQQFSQVNLGDVSRQQVTGINFKFTVLLGKKQP